MKSNKEKFGGEFTAEIEQKNKEVSKPVKIFAWIFGVVGLLVFGGGMSIALLHAAETSSLIIGSVVGIAGMAMIISNKYIYDAIVAKRKYKKEMTEVKAELKDKEEDERSE